MPILKNPTFCRTPRFGDLYLSQPLRFSENGVLAKYTFFGVLQEGILGDPEKPYVCSILQFVDPWGNPYDFPKMAFSKIHVFLWFCKMPILVIPKNPTFCSIRQFVDP